MPNIQIRDVPDEVHEALVARAARAGQSLQQYLSRQLALLADTPSLEDVIDRIEARRAGGALTMREAVEALDAERAQRDRR